MHRREAALVPGLPRNLAASDDLATAVAVVDDPANSSGAGDGRADSAGAAGGRARTGHAWKRVRTESSWGGPLHTLS